MSTLVGLVAIVLCALALALIIVLLHWMWEKQMLQVILGWAFIVFIMYMFVKVAGEFGQYLLDRL